MYGQCAVMNHEISCPPKPALFPSVGAHPPPQPPAGWLVVHQTTCFSYAIAVYTRLKNIENVEMACQKVYKQGRDDIIMKVNLQSLTPASFSH